MRRKSRYNSTIGKLIFIVPALVIIVVVAYAFFELNSPGTLIVEAEAANGTQIHVQAQVNGTPLTTPATLTLGQGNYVANFSTIQWFYPPASRDVSIIPSHTEYAVGLYQPKTEFIQVTQDGFNVTSISVLHGVTPVIWKNPSGTTVTFASGTFAGGQFTQVRLDPGQTYTYTFTTVGNYEFLISSSNHTLDIQVK